MLRKLRKGIEVGTLDLMLNLANNWFVVFLSFEGFVLCDFKYQMMDGNFRFRIKKGIFLVIFNMIVLHFLLFGLWENGQLSCVKLCAMISELS